MLVVTLPCLNPDECREKDPLLWQNPHVVHFCATPQDAPLYVHSFASIGVTDLTIKTESGLILGGITQNGYAWASCPN